MSSRRASDQRGFTLLDCEIAIIVLSLLTVGVMELTRNHGRVVRSLESWHEGRQVWFVVQPEDAIERQLGLPARLSPDGARQPIFTGKKPYRVHLLEADLTLAPAEARAIVQLVERDDEGDKGKGHGKGKGKGKGKGHGKGGAKGGADDEDD